MYLLDLEDYFCSEGCPNPCLDNHATEAKLKTCLINNNILHRNNTLVSAGGLSFLHSLLDLAFDIRATWKKPNKSHSEQPFDSVSSLTFLGPVQRPNFHEPKLIH